MKTRIIKKADKYYPQYLKEYPVLKKFMGIDNSHWNYFYRVESSVSVLGEYSKWEEEISFSSEENAQHFLEQESKTEEVIVVWSSSEKVEKRPIKRKDVPICTTCSIDMTGPTYNIAEDYFRECTECGHQVNVY